MGLEDGWSWTRRLRQHCGGSRHGSHQSILSYGCGSCQPTPSESDCNWVTVVASVCQAPLRTCKVRCACCSAKESPQNSQFLRSPSLKVERSLPLRCLTSNRSRHFRT